MTSYFISFARVAVMLGFALLAMPLLKGRSAVARRLVLSVAFAAALVIPFVPAWRVDAPLASRLVGRVVVEPIAAAVAVAPSVASVPARAVDWLALAWTLGAVVVAMRFAVGVLAAQRLARRAAAAPRTWAWAISRAEAATGHRAVVRVSPDIEAPAVTGLVSAVVIVPTSSSSWTDERRLAVLVHELAHVAAHDLRVQLLATAVCSLHWFNPLAWLAARRLRLERELAADEAVLRSGVRASTYAADLLAIAGTAPLGTIAIGEKPLPKRIAAIVADRRPAILGPKGASMLALGTTAIAFGVACTTAAAAKPAPAEGARAADPDLQALAERELESATKEWKATGGTILVLSPKGDVLADAGGRSDRAYVTGSTMKSILLAAALDEGVVSERDVFDCTHGERAGKVLHDASPLGQAALPELVSTSSNVGFAQIFDRLGGARYDRALRRFHFATPPELAKESAGDWDGALTAIGATMNATPRQVALAYAALADGGDGIVKPSTAARVGAILEGVVASDHGTGTKARVAGVRVAGKTGTSDWTAPDGTKATYASFVGFVPADHPRYVVFVGVESPAGEDASGGLVAAPVFSRIAARALAR